MELHLEEWMARTRIFDNRVLISILFDINCRVRALESNCHLTVDLRFDIREVAKRCLSTWPILVATLSQYGGQPQPR